MRSLVIALMALLATPALADRLLSGDEAHSRLAGKNARFTCSDGTVGRAQYNEDGAGLATFRQPNRPDHFPDETGSARVISRGDLVCIAWRQLAAQGEGCYRMTERAAGQYRVTSPDGRNWCDFQTN